MANKAESSGGGVDVDPAYWQFRSEVYERVGEFRETYLEITDYNGHARYPASPKYAGIEPGHWSKIREESDLTGEVEVFLGPLSSAGLKNALVADQRLIEALNEKSLAKLRPRDLVGDDLAGIFGLIGYTTDGWRGDSQIMFRTYMDSVKAAIQRQEALREVLHFFATAHDDLIVAARQDVLDALDEGIGALNNNAPGKELGQALLQVVFAAGWTAASGAAGVGAIVNTIGEKAMELGKKHSEEALQNLAIGDGFAVSYRDIREDTVDVLRKTAKGATKMSEKLAQMLNNLTENLHKGSFSGSTMAPKGKGESEQITVSSRSFSPDPPDVANTKNPPPPDLFRMQDEDDYDVLSRRPPWSGE